jgi:thiol:disulfide interchange protein DsbC
MVDGNTPPKAAGPCDTAVIARNLALGERYRVQGTPAVVFEDGTRAPGAIPAEQLESRLLAAAKR